MQIPLFVPHILALSRVHIDLPVYSLVLSAYQLYTDPKSGEKNVAPVGSTNNQETPGPHEAPTKSQTNNSWFPWFGAGASGKDVPGNEGASATAAQESVSMAERFKRAFSRDVRVHFVGAWCVINLGRCAYSYSLTDLGILSLPLDL
jgi:hypothetical protein